MPASSQQPWQGLRIEPEGDSSPYKEREYKKLYNQVRNPHLLDGLLARDGYLGRLESDGTMRSCDVTPPGSDAMHRRREVWSRRVLDAVRSVRVPYPRNP
ncbi:MAG: hypothetical protein OXP74_16590 [Acidobacteriota bacterium]|nr:hypothetical protein [Acidobacteriota bacterium]